MDISPEAIFSPDTTMLKDAKEVKKQSKASKNAKKIIQDYIGKPDELFAYIDSTGTIIIKDRKMQLVKILKLH